MNRVLPDHDAACHCTAHRPIVQAGGAYNFGHEWEGAKVKSIRIHQYGGPEVMQIDELQTPTPAENQALVRVEAAGVNFMDIYQRSGTYQLSLPAALGAE